MLIISLLFSMLFLAICWYVRKNETELTPEAPAPYLMLTLLIAFVLRSAFALGSKGYEVDMSCFSTWSWHVYEQGFGAFYESIGFCDYPPGYLYILYLHGWLTNLLGLAYQTIGYDFLLKLPAILCDIGLILFCAKAAEKLESRLTIPLLMALSPALIMTSSVWGQVDSVLALLILLSFSCGVSGKLPLSVVFFTLAALVKPQALMFAPLIMVLFAFQKEPMFSLPFKSHTAVIICNYILTVLFSCSIFYLLSVPFFGWNPIPGLIEKYYNTLSSYPYATVNALNLNFLSGGNWADLNTPFLFLNYGIWSTILLLASIGITVWMLLRTKEKKAIFLVAGIFLLSVFTLTAKMHERYFFLCIPLFAVSYLVHHKKELFRLFSGLSVTYFLNLVMAYMEQEYHIAKDSGFGIFLSALHIAMCAFAYISYFRIYPLQKQASEEKTPFLKERKTKKMLPADHLFMWGITLIYAVTAFAGLGDFTAPQTGLTLQEQDEVTLVVTPGSYDYMMLMEGMELGDLTLSGSYDGIHFEELTALPKRNVFSWKKVDLSSDYSHLRLTVNHTDNDWIELLEIGMISADAKAVAPIHSVIYNHQPIAELTDEQSLVPLYPDYQNGTYFDEIYHARTAYEFLHDLPIYENTHPQLGKMIISYGVKLFGFTPFGYRCIATLLGVLMLPLLYLFLKRLFQSSFIATLGTVLFAADFMHFTQTRIATIDVFIVFFILLMYYFMYRFWEVSLEKVDSKKYVKYLFLCGIMFGLGISAKWTGAYAGIGLALIYVLSLCNIYRQAKEENQSFPKLLTLLLLCGTGFFVILPALIYFASYIPYFHCMGDPVNLDSFLRINMHMFDYHSGLADTHPFASKWYQWLLNLKPIWYYQTINPFNETMKGTIAAFGNPVVWIGGLIALLRVARDFKKQKALFIIIAFVVQILPWIPVAEARTTYIYHYFPAIPFLIMGICYVFDHYLKKYNYSKKTVWTLCCFSGAAVAMFLLFYPVLSGMECSVAYIDALKLFPTWIF